MKLKAALLLSLVLFAPLAQAAWQHQTTGTIVSASNTNTTPLTVTYPATVNPGDILFYVALDNNAGTTLTWSNSPTQLAYSSTNGGRGIWATIASGSEDGGTVTVSSSSTGRVKAWIMRYTGG